MSLQFSGVNIQRLRSFCYAVPQKLFSLVLLFQLLGTHSRSVCFALTDQVRVAGLIVYSLMKTLKWSHVQRKA